MKRKTCTAVAAAVLVAAAGAWAAGRWDTWFGMPDEPPYAPPDSPSRVLLTFGDGGEDARNVSWQCGTEVEDAYVELGSERVAARGEVFASRSGRAAYYVARLRRLRPGTAYRYRVCTGRRRSPWYTFRTCPAGRDRFAFLYVGDVQDTIGGEANRILREAFGRTPDAEFLVCGGDLTDRPSDANWAETFRGIDSVAQRVPLLAVTGNHDYLKGVVQRLERRFSLVFSYFLDSMVGESQVYTLRYANAQFFLLDSNRELPYLLAQRRWLERQLRASRAKWKILVLHHPLYSIRGCNNLPQRWAFDGLAADHGVDLVLQGHEHAYARMTRRDRDGRATTPVYTVSHCSPKNYRIEFDDRFDKFGISSRYYQAVRIAGDTLALSAHDARTHALYDSLLVVKHGARAAEIVDLGSGIAENMTYTPRPGNRKDRAFANRIADYMRRHPERTFAAGAAAGRSNRPGP